MEHSVEATESAQPRLALSYGETVYAVLLLTAVSLLWLFNLFVQASGDIASEEIPKIVAYCLAVIAFQGVLLFALRRWGAFVFVLLAVANTYSLYIVFSEDRLSSIVHVVIPLGLIALYFVLLQVALSAGRVRPWLFGALYLAVSLVGFLGVLPLARAPALAGPGPEFASIQIVDFKRKPNIYFLGFDALIPQPLAQKLLGIDRPAYVDVIAKHGGRIIPNLFADEVPTKRFWGRVMTILPFEGKGAAIDKYLVGLKPAALLATLHRNGYETHFSFWTKFFGRTKGPLLTSYAFYGPYSTCSFLDGPSERYGLLGYCLLYRRGWFGAVEPQGARKAESKWDEFYMNRLRVATRAESKPQFFAAHYPHPNHTSKSYRGTQDELERFRRRYEKASEQAAAAMEKMLSEIRSNDPTAIIIVFGDHGPLTRVGAPYHEDPQGVVQDRHGIMGAAFGADECIPYMLPKAGAKYQTFAQVVAGLLQCLSGGTSPLLKDFDFNRITQAPELRFEDYVYE